MSQTPEQAPALQPPLKGIRVVDLSNVLAGPVCSYLFALLGAEVIKVENPASGDLARKMGADLDHNRQLMGASFIATNANKRSLTLDLKNPEGLAILKQLIDTSDLVLENFKPGTARRLGLDFEVLKKTNPKLVYCAVSGFGQTGPLSQRPAYDQIIQSMCGLMSLTGTPETAPVRAGFVICDTFAAVCAAFASLSGIFRARMTGQGALIDVSMLDSSLLMCSWLISNYLNAGHVPKPMGNENHSAAPSGTYMAKDSPITIVCNEEKQFAALCEAMDLSHLAKDPVWSDRFERVRRRAELMEILNPVLQSKTAQEWEEILLAKGVPCAQVRTLPEILNHPHIAHRNFIREVSGTPTWEGDIKIPTLGFKFVGEEEVPLNPPPGLGYDTDSILAELGLQQDGIDNLRNLKVI